MTPRVKSKAPLLLLLLLGCTDYDLKNIQNPGLNAEDDTAMGANSNGTTADSGSSTDDSDDPNNEDDDDCVEDFTAFDIEEVSTLQDAVSYAVAGWRNDAVVLSWDDSILEPEQTWRVSAVDILVLIPTASFGTFQDGQDINIQVFDSNNPTNGSEWSMTQQVVRSELTWSDYTLPYDAYYAGPFQEYAQKGAWFRFDLRDVIPETGMNSSEFIAGVWWNPPGGVKVGYSNFNQDCSKNWTDYGSGWTLNSENTLFFGCSWPMMRVQLEITTPGDCDE
jgi:hypothetical protein